MQQETKSARTAYETIRVEQADGIATLTLNRPRVLNALNAELFDELEQAFLTFKTDATVRAILLTGSGDKAFAAGADINEIRAAGSTGGEALSRRGQAVFRLIETCGKPVIALINGFALGGGCELALACTLRIAADSARLGQPEIKLGLIPGYGGTQRLPRLIGRSAALKLMLTGEIVSAAEALRIGLVDEVAVGSELLLRGRQLASVIAQSAPLAVRATLEAVHRGAELDLGEAIGVEAKLFGSLCATEDVAEGTSAFLEKRVAVWKDR